MAISDHEHHREGDNDFVRCAEFNKLDRTVNGNGQPGVVQKLDRIIGWVERQEGQEQALRNARARAKWVFGLVVTATLAIGGWGVQHVWSIVGPPAGAIIREYWEHHPTSSVQPHSFFHEPEPSVSSNQKPQHAVNE